MNKKLISIVTIMAMLVVMIIPAWADGGDNTGDDNFGAAIYVKKDGVEGAYTLGTAKEFKLEFWASGIVGKQVVRTVSVTGDNQVSSIEYKDGGEWYDISGFNKEMTIAGNDLDRTIRVVFDKEGRYTISYGLVNTEGQDVVKDQLNIEIADGQIKNNYRCNSRDNNTSGSRNNYTCNSRDNNISSSRNNYNNSKDNYSCTNTNYNCKGNKNSETYSTES